MHVESKHIHWEEIYKKQTPKEVSWYEEFPRSSLYLIEKYKLPESSPIIDVGGGESLLADNLIRSGYRDISVLDISPTALDRVKQRLGRSADEVTWIVADIATFIPDRKYALWHDRAAFHFLTMESDIRHYVQTVGHHVLPNGYLIIGTFSVDGPAKCSGLNVMQYSERSLTELFSPEFQLRECFNVDHITPSGVKQNFIFCCFQRNG